MIKCNICGREYSPKVYELHIKRCKAVIVKNKENENKDIVNLEDMTVKELRELAKEKNIDAYYNMKKEELIEALKG